MNLLFESSVRAARSHRLISAMLAAAIFAVAFCARAQTCAPVTSGIISWWAGEGNALDDLNTNNGTLVGPPSFAPGKVGQAFSFNGPGQFVRVPNSPSLQISNALTLEAWIHPTNYSPLYSAILSKFDAAGGINQASWVIYIDPNGLGLFSISTNGASPTASVNSSNVCPLNAWTHVAGTYDGTNLQIYFNGALQGSAPGSGRIFPGTDDVGIGAKLGGVGNGQTQSPFGGLIDEPALFNRPLQPAEILAIYNAGSAGKCPFPPDITAQPTNETVSAAGTATFSVGATGSQPLYFQWLFDGTNINGATNSNLVLPTVQPSQAGNYSVAIMNGADPGNPVISGNASLNVPAAPPCDPPPSGIVSWWSGESNFLDNLGTNNGIPVNSPTFSPGKVGLAFNFDGSSQYILVSNSPSLRFSNAMTAEAWVYPTARNSQASAILCKYDAAPLNQASWTLFIDGAGHGGYLASTIGSAGSAEIFTTNLCPLNAWTHLAATYDGSNVRIYFNGSLQSTAPMTGAIFPGTDNLGIGANIGGGVASLFGGMIDEPTVYNRALASNEVSAIYNAGSSGKCPLAPTISSQPASQTAYVGSQVTFSVIAIGPQPLSYQWYFDGTNLSSATGASLTLTNLQLDQGGSYSVVVNNGALAPVTSSNAVLTVLPVPACVPAPSGIVSWWSGESNALDNLGRNPGNFVGTPAYASGKIGTAFSFNGSSQFIRVANSPSLQFSNALTVEAWIYPTNNGSFSAVLSKFDAAGEINQASWVMYVNPSGQGRFDICTNGVSPTASVLSTNGCPLYTWTHLAGTYDGTNLQIYFNGSLQGSVPASGNLFPGADDVGIGAKVGGVNNGNVQTIFSGRIDEAALFSRALNSNEIESIYVSGLCVIPPAISAQPANTMVLPGHQVTLSVGALGGQPLSYQWYFDGTNIAGATASSYSITNANAGQSGVYSVTVSNAGGFIASSNALLTVLPPPTCVPVPAGVVSWWPLESNVVDSVGGNSGTIVGSPIFSPGKVGSGLRLNGNNQFARIPDSLSLHLSNAISIEAWIYPTNYGFYSAVLSKFDAAGGINQASWVMYLDPSGLGRFDISTDGVEPTASVYSSNICPLDAWTHVAGTYDGTNLQIYFNGSLQGSVAASGSLFPGTDDVGIGAKLGGVDNTQVQTLFAGIIDEPTIYNRALTPAEILGIYFADSVGKCPFVLPPSITSVQPGFQKVSPGASVTFTSAFVGSPPLNFQWELNGVPIPGATNQSITVPNVTTANAGNYSLVVSNSVSSAVSSNAVLEVALVSVFGNNHLLTTNHYSFTNSVNVSLADFYPNGLIFYTLDGTLPTPDSTLYTGPFTITSDCVIRTLGFDPDFVQSAVSDPITIQIIPIVILTTGTPGGGSILVNPSGPSHPSNTIVSVTAIPSSGWTLLQWLGDLSGTNLSNNVLMDRNKSVQAIFGTTVSNAVGSGGGSIVFNPPGPLYPYGTVLRATAVPQPGNFFVDWGDAASGDVSPFIFSVTNANSTVSALFFTLGNGDFALSVIPIGPGTISIDPQANSYTNGTPITITATPNTNCTFLGWSGDASGTNNLLNIVLNQSQTIYANFSTNSTLLIYSVTEPGTADGVALDLNGLIGAHYRLDASSDLVNWTNLYDLTNYVGTIHYIDDAASNLTHRHYRAKTIVP